jgi:ssDNA-binding Zn-finger/Zn-ribbon topoisomerase 1
MVVLHDLYFEQDGYTAQIDYLVITRGRVFVIECKNLFGDIEIDNSGCFTRIMRYGKAFKKEGIYSPITQNQRHLELIKLLRQEAKPNLLTKALFNKNFPTMYRSVIVLANPKTILNDKYAPKAIKAQVIRADQLINHIKAINSEPNSETITEKDMLSLAQFFLDHHKENPNDYLKKYQSLLAEEHKTPPPNEPLVKAQPVKEQMIKVQPAKEPPIKEQLVVSQPDNVSAEQENESIKCPKCGSSMIIRTAKKGDNIGKQFYGCSQYPHCRQIVNLVRQ